MPGDHNKKYSKIQERRIAKHLNGELQPGSGSLQLATKKGDVKYAKSLNWKLLLDGKTTKCKTYESGVRSKEIKKDWLMKLKTEALDGGYDLSALVISFDNIKDYYILDDIDFKNLYQAVLEYESIVDELQNEIQTLKKQIVAPQKDTSSPKYFNLTNTEE